MTTLQGIIYESRLAADISDYELQCTTAELLNISIEEYLDFVRDMEVDTIEYSLKEIESMYNDYISQGYNDDMSISAYEAYACIDRMGWN